LSKLSEDSLVLEPYALWSEVTKLKFFAPPNPSHVSHSLLNYQDNYSQEGPNIEVPTTTLDALFAKHQLEAIPLMKIDIEGAEIEVFKDMLEKSILPRQLLVEFHWTRCLSDGSRKRVEETDAELRKAGYKCRHFNGYANYLYVRS
jgi:FkbM family methyltransferase